MKRILSTIIIAVVLLSTLYITAYATAGEAGFTATVVATADKQQAKPGDTVVVTLTVKDTAHIGTGISAMEGVLEYDKNFFEEITSISPAIINTSTGHFVLMLGITEQTETEVLKINFKVKSDATGSGNISIKDIKLSTGEVDATSDDVSLNVAIATEPPAPENNTVVNNTVVNNAVVNNTVSNNTVRNNTVGNNTTKNNTITSGSKDNTTSGNKIPNAGVKITVMSLILVLAVISGLTYRYYKKYEKL